jgi:peptidoglycan-associated lipoprotein
VRLAKSALPLIALAAGAATAAQAQLRLPRLPVIIPLEQGEPAAPPSAPGFTSGALQADLVVKAGSDTVYFSPRAYALDANAIATLTAQARWLLANPFVNIRLEGHGDQRDTRDYALAIGDRRANAVRDFLILQGVAPHRITVLSWGKERPGQMRIGPTLVAVGPRVVTRIQ